MHVGGLAALEANQASTATLTRQHRTDLAPGRPGASRVARTWLLLRRWQRTGLPPGWQNRERNSQRTLPAMHRVNFLANPEAQPWSPTRAQSWPKRG
jgi:hypothetical protein